MTDGTSQDVESRGVARPRLGAPAAAKEKAGVPRGLSPSFALGGLDTARTAGVRFGSVGADAEYGKAPEFRRALQQRDLLYAVGILPQQRVYPADVVLHPPERKRPGVRPPRHPTPSVESVQAQDWIGALGDESFREVTWRRGIKGPLKARFAATRVRMAEEDPIGSGR